MPSITSAATVILRPASVLTVSALAGAAGTAVFTPPTGGLSRSITLAPLGPYVIGPFDRAVSVVLTPSAGTLEYTESYPTNTEADPPAYSWANRPLIGVPLSARIRVIDVGVSPGIVMIWDGARWIADGVQCLARGTTALPLTGTTNETALASITLPAGLLGINGGVEYATVWSCPSSGNNKTYRARLGGIAGTEFLRSIQTTNISFSDRRRIRNRASAASQIGSYPMTNSGGLGLSTNALPTGTVDTSAAVDFVLSGQLASGSETLYLENHEIWLLP